MSWKDNLQPGKFREAPFFFESTGAELGRRVQVHEYPGRDRPFAEDLGRKARRWTLELYVLGADYMVGRDALIVALEQPGPGTLVHPYLGALQAVVVEARGPQESTREGGMARFSVTFAEAGDNKFPTATADTGANVATWADNARQSASGSFVAAYSVTGQPAWVPNAAQDLLGTVLDQIDGLSRLFPAMPTQATAFVADLATVRGALDGLIRQPDELALAVTGLIGSLVGLFASPSDAVRVASELWSAGDTVASVPETTPSRQQQADNQEAILALVGQAAVVEAAAVVPTLDFASTDEATTVQDQIDEQLDIEMATADDETYQNLADLRVAMIRDIAARPDLARLVSYVPSATLPALVLAYQLYGSVDQEADLVSRNHIRHPGFVPGGSSLEVLAYA